MTNQATCSCPVTGKKLVWECLKKNTIADIGDGSMLGSSADTWALYSPALVARARQTDESRLKGWLASLKLEEVLPGDYDLVQLKDLTNDYILVVGLAF